MNRISQPMASQHASKSSPISTCHSRRPQPLLPQPPNPSQIYTSTRSQPTYFPIAKPQHHRPAPIPFRNHKPPISRPSQFSTKLQSQITQIALRNPKFQIAVTSMMGSARGMLVLLVLACVAVGESTPDSLVRLFGDVREPAAAASCGPQVDIETPACTVVEERSKYELRKYTDSEIWVESLIANSSYELATFTGFYRCFNFISGENSKKMKIEMTGPVHIKPVSDSNGYTVGFFVPSRFKTVNDLPTPTDKRVHFYQPGGALKAVIGPFGGFPTDKDYEAKFAELKAALDKDGLKYDQSTVMYAGYSSPFQFRNRQQEVHVNIVPGL